MSENRFISKYSDVVLAGLVIAIIGMMLIPLPTMLLDVLLTINISLSVLILLISLYVPKALNLSIFPTLLLLTTLYRLALSVSTTRLILSTGDPGEVVVAFGNFVAAGNFVVGAIVFIILVIVNFLVIAKGSERVSEVGARFTLDAMPGKQMSIDADMRGGVIDTEEGKRRRRDLERESALMGAMDGAMKFVKGDAIANIIVTVVNIVGGLAIGVMQKGMGIDAAARKYTLLTIGDGLVGMIPAILISTAAGIIVTRVGGEEEGTHLGKDVTTQLTRYPRALAIAGGMLLVFGAIPGLPTVPFLLLGGIVGGFGYWLMKKEKEGIKPPPKLVDTEEEDEDVVAPSIAAPPPPVNPDSEMFVPMVTPVVLEVAPDLVRFVDPSADKGRFMSELIPQMRNGLFVELGVRFPSIRVRGNSSLPAAGYAIYINEVPLVLGQVVLKHVLANESVNRLKMMGIPGTPSVNPATMQAAAWVPSTHAESVRAIGPTVWNIPAFLILHLSAVLKRYAPDFIGVQEAQFMLDQLEKISPTLIKETIPRVVSIVKLTEILKRLVGEGVSIRDMQGILQAIAENSQETDSIMLTEHVRVALRRPIASKHARGTTSLLVYSLDRDIERIIQESIKYSASGSAYLAIEPDISREIVGAVRRECGFVSPSAQRPVILTKMQVRRYVYNLLSHEFTPPLPVMSYQELPPEIQIKVITQIMLSR
ncbi:MAG: type III secretion system export apparatus subunit SctV [Cystobacterineae bacterium]|nr:type III secretion system export apparatus subunit SctV [Cystobacterineae bacterium]